MNEKDKKDINIKLLRIIITNSITIIIAISMRNIINVLN